MKVVQKDTGPDLCYYSMAATHLVLFHLVLDVLQVRTHRLRPHPFNPPLRHIQPVGELLQLLVLQAHQHLVESGG